MSESTSQSPVSSLPWSAKRLMVALLVTCAAIASMWGAWRDWGTEAWKQEEHSHVFLVIPFGAAILYVNRQRFAGLKSDPSWVGPILVAGGIALALEGFNNAHQSFWHMGAVLVAAGAAITVLGHHVALRFWPVFLMLGFMVPMPNTLRLQLAFPLQTKMAQITQAIFEFFGEPVGRQGNSITYKGQHVLIVEACNGLRGVFTLILVTWLFAFIVPLKWWLRWSLILISPLVALVCNVIRLVPTLLLHGHASKTIAEGFHDLAGWLMVFIAFFILLFLIKFIEAFGIEIRTDCPETAEPAEPSKTPAQTVSV